MTPLASQEALYFARQRVHLQGGLGRSPAEPVANDLEVKLCAGACLVHAELTVKRGPEAAREFEQSVVSGGSQYLLEQIDDCGLDLHAYKRIIKENDTRAPDQRRAWFVDLLAAQLKP